MSSTERQFCAICAWRETCNKKFCVPDGGARCPEYTRDISIKSPPKTDEGEEQEVRKP